MENSKFIRKKSVKLRVISLKISTKSMYSYPKKVGEKTPITKTKRASPPIPQKQMN